MKTPAVGSREKNGYCEGEVGMKKAILKHTADTLQKVGIAGIAIALFQERTDCVGLAVGFLLMSDVCIILEARQ